MTKVTLRIPTNDTYAFAEIVFERPIVTSNENGSAYTGFDWTPERVKEEYDKYIQAFKVQEGISEKDMNAYMDKYLMGDLRELNEQYQKMSPSQQSCIQTIKRSLARIKARQNKDAPRRDRTKDFEGSVGQSGRN